MKRGIHWVLAVYRGVLTPLRQTFGLYGCCRHLPTCSEYCREAVERYGYWRGLPLCLRRLARCHPWGTSGWDPVPRRDAASCGKEEGREGCGGGAVLERALPVSRDGGRCVAGPTREGRPKR